MATELYVFSNLAFQVWQSSLRMMHNTDGEKRKNDGLQELIHHNSAWRTHK